MKYRAKKPHPIRDFIEDMVGALLLFAMIPLFPYAVAIAKALL